MCKTYKRLPSELLNIEEEYAGYCMNEACHFIMRMMEDGQSPSWGKKYSSFSEMYKDYK